MQLKSTLFRAIAIVLAVGFICSAAPMQDSGPSKELLQWVGDAIKAGKGDEQIRKDAALAGWQESAVNKALVAVSSESSHKAADDVKPTVVSDSSATAANTGTPSADGVAKAPTAPGAQTGVKGVAGGASSPPTEKAVLDRGAPDDYQIGAGDVLHIAVFHEPDATVQSVVVRTDGKISMPLIKEVSVLGLTPSQVEQRITQQLTKFLTAPDVTVIVTSINSKKIYIIGAVKKEGPLPFTYPMNVLQALSEAGGLTEFAKRKKIYVLRNKNGQELRLRFDYDAVLKGEHMELNVPLIASDTIIVPGN
jgi:polysaccharide biosynthesis/export protein